MMEFISPDIMVFVSRRENKNSDNEAQRTDYSQFLNVVDTKNVSEIKFTQPIVVPNKTHQQNVINIFKIKVDEDLKKCLFISSGKFIFRLTFKDDVKDLIEDECCQIEELPKDEEISKPDDVVISNQLNMMAYIHTNDTIII